ncbi:hypothetical protein [Leclercia adecarboxylata]|uniref:hypothetical protein n=1 Tax=Leclercia adecarboxylata TaxID=83655 RepID=UPI0013E0406E|nr:hypothetical protein [Leclercia adecarboxylata]QIG27630.1 hypothetical protein FY044_04845 [Leclercia adecarboxylata]
MLFRTICFSALLCISQPSLAKTFSGFQLSLWSESRAEVVTQNEKYNRDPKEVQKHITPNDAMNNGFYVGFIGGVADGLIRDGSICPANEDQLPLFLFSVDEYMKQHTRQELLTQDAYEIVKQVLVKQFGCHTK